MSPFGQTVIYVVLWGALFDSATMAIAVHWLGYEFHLGQLVRLLVDGRLANGDPGLAALFARLDDHPTEPLWFFLWANAFALVSALLWRAMVHFFKLDHPSFPLFEKVRGDAPWNYLFRGIDVSHSTPDAIVVAALVTLKDATLLYTGLLVDYELTDKGELDRIMISNAARRHLSDDAKGATPIACRPQTWRGSTRSRATVWYYARLKSLPSTLSFLCWNRSMTRAKKRTSNGNTHRPISTGGQVIKHVVTCTALRACLATRGLTQSRRTSDTLGATTLYLSAVSTVQLLASRITILARLIRRAMNASALTTKRQRHGKC